MKIAPVFARHARNCAGSGGSVKATRYAGGLCPALTFAAVLPAFPLRGRRDEKTLRRGLPNKKTPHKQKAERPKGRKAERQNTLTPFLKPLLPFTVKNNCTFSRRAGQ